MELGLGDGAVDQPVLRGLDAADRLAEHQHLLGPPEADHQREERDATVARGDAVLHVAVAEAGVVGRDTKSQASAMFTPMP